MVSGAIPPTGNRRVPAGSTARIALMTRGPTSSAGNIFRASAPADSAAKASVGVAIPGRLTNPAALAARITAVSACGMTTRSAPISFSRATCSTARTVPAPTSASRGSRRRMAAMLSNGSGEFSGTSIRRKPRS